MSDRIWLTWESQRRNRTTSRAVGARLFEFDHPYPPVVRYPLSIARTLWTLLRARPRLIFVQNPSIVLATLVTVYGRWFGTPVVIDAHNAGIEPLDGPAGWTRTLTRFIVRNAPLTMVSNPRLADHVHRAGGRAAVLPDPVPELTPPQESDGLGGEFNVVFICTWASDEPYLEVIEASRHVTAGTHIYITGNSRGRETAAGRTMPKNVHLTGFVSEDEFVGLLFGADLVVDLTTREDCLVCGAYESVAAGTPMLLSDTRALRDYFERGALYTDNTAADIAAKLDLARERLDRLETEVAALKATLSRRWTGHLADLEDALESLVPGPVGRADAGDIGVRADIDRDGS